MQNELDREIKQAETILLNLDGTKKSERIITTDSKITKQVLISYIKRLESKLEAEKRIGKETFLAREDELLTMLGQQRKTSLNLWDTLVGANSKLLSANQLLLSKFKETAPTKDKTSEIKNLLEDMASKEDIDYVLGLPSHFETTKTVIKFLKAKLCEEKNKGQATLSKREHTLLQEVEKANCCIKKLSYLKEENRVLNMLLFEKGMLDFANSTSDEEDDREWKKLRTE